MEVVVWNGSIDARVQRSLQRRPTVDPRRSNQAPVSHAFDQNGNVRHRYIPTLIAIARGLATVNKIASVTGKSRPSAQLCVQTLTDHGIVDRQRLPDDKTWAYSLTEYGRTVYADVMRDRPALSRRDAGV